MLPSRRHSHAAGSYDRRPAAPRFFDYLRGWEPTKLASHNTGGRGAKRYGTSSHPLPQEIQVTARFYAIELHELRRLIQVSQPDGWYNISFQAPARLFDDGSRSWFFAAGYWSISQTPTESNGCIVVL